MAPSEENKAAVRQFFATASGGDLDDLGAVVSPDYVLHDPALPEDVRGLEGLRELVEMYRSAISDLELTIDHQLADGDYVATRYTFCGTHAGDIMGTPATGRDVTVAGLLISRFQNGMVAEEWEVQDTFGMLRQIGALPEVVTS